MTFLSLTLSLAWGIAVAGEAPPKTPPPDKPTTHYEPRQLRGWTVRIHKDLLEEKNLPLLDETLKELDNHLYRIERVVPDTAVELSLIHI